MQTGGEGGAGEKAETKKPAVKYAPPGDAAVQLDIPAGAYLFGSETGEAHRNPSKEIDAVEADVHAFRIDRYPHPNRKEGPWTTGVTREEAAGLCAQAGKRLCTELEWEVACKGPAGEQYAAGGVSGFGMEGIGAASEWTSSPWIEPEWPSPRGAVVKGLSSDFFEGKPRCSMRTMRQPEEASKTIGFRCCAGEANERPAPLEPLRKPFEEAADFPLEKFQLLVRSIPQMGKVAANPMPFDENELRYVLLRREINVKDAYAGYLFTNKPVWWRPVRGEELLVLTGKSERSSFVLALYHLGKGAFRHAASLVLLDSPDATVPLPIPVILVTGVDRTVVNWAPCWNCSEGGSLYLDDKVDTQHTGDFLIHVSYRWGP